MRIGAGNPELTTPFVGVVADFHQHSFHSPIGPVAIGNKRDLQHGIAMRFDAANENGLSSPALGSNFQSGKKSAKRVAIPFLLQNRAHSGILNAALRALLHTTAAFLWHTPFG